VIAFLIAGIASLSITLVVGAVISTGKLRGERDTAFRRLMAAKLEEGRAWRRSRAPGQRSRALKALEEAAPGASAFELRNEIIGALALMDLVVEEESEFPEGLLTRDDDLKRWATRGPENSLLIYKDARPGNPLAVLKGGDGPVEYVRFSPSGRYLGVRHFNAGSPILVWDIDRQSVVLTLERPLRGMPIAFRDDEAQVAAPTAGVIQVWSFPEGRVLRRLASSPSCRELAFDPRGERLAVAGDGEDTYVARVIDAADGRILARLHHPERVSHLAWHPEKDVLATACFDFNVYLWDARSGRRLNVLSGHSAEVVRVGFTHDGELLASSGWDDQTFLWDPSSGAALIAARGWITGLPRSGRRVGFRIGEFHGGTWRIEGGAEHRALRVPGARIEKRPHRIAISPDGRWLAAECGTGGARVWSIASPRVSADLEAGRVVDVGFHSDGSLVTSGSAGMERWPMREEESGRWTVGPPQLLKIRGSRFSLDAEGKRVAVLYGNAIVVHELDDAREVARFEHRGVHRVQLSSSGRWAVTTTWKGSGVRVWDATSGELLKEIAGGSAHAVFSPDERWLAVGMGDHFSVWETGGWTCRFRIGKDGEGDLPRMVAFSNDSRLLALARAIGQLTIHLAETGEELARFESPGAEKISWTAFSRSGRFLAWASPGDQSVILWDLSLVRRELASFKLDWDPSGGPAVAEGASPETLRVEWGTLEPRLRADQLVQRARDLEVLESLTRRIDLEPAPAAYAERAEIHRRLGALDEALADLDLALDDSTEGDVRPVRQIDLLRALRSRADLRRGSGQWRLARADLERIVELDPEDARSARELAFSLCLEPEESVDDPRRAMGLAERSATCPW
jgi:WD40 repeat protein